MEFVDKDHEVEFLLEVQEEDKTWRPATLYRSRVQGRFCGGSVGDGRHMGLSYE